MQKVKNEKGITIIALGVTIVVLLLISVPIIVNISSVTQLATYSKFKEDIDNLRESISIAFYSDNISSIGPIYEGSLDFLNLEQNGKKVKNDNDNDVYYAINIDEVNKRISADIKKLNYGKENNEIGNEEVYSGSNDVYIINEASRTIYYVKGITYKGNTYYRLPEDLSITENAIKPGEIVTEFNKYFTDKEGNTAKVPVGFKVSDKEEEQIVSKGLVISDEQENEFVWIPVNSFKNENGNEIEINFDRYIYGSQVNGGIDNIYQSTRIYNNNGDKDFFYESDNAFEKLSVLENKGFYIARYEAGSNEVRTDSSSNDAPVVKKGANVYNYINRNDAKTLAESFINTDDLSSRLCSSQAWDTAIQFLKQTGNESYLTDSSLGNYNGTLKTTGNSTSVNNIFDLGGNVNEWTTELYSDDSLQFTVRGGSIENTSSASPAPSRIATGEIKSDNIGFRITLFLSANYSSVPYEYKEVNYIEATGTQYLDNINLMQNYRYVISTVLQKKNIYYNFFDSPSAMLWISTGNLIELNANANRGNIEFDKKILIDNDNTGIENLVKVDGKTVITLPKTNRTSFSVTMLNRNGKQCFYGKIYYIKVYDGDKLTYNFIPCYRKSDKKTGMYDTIGNKFFECRGTGEFNLGPEI